MGALGVQTLTLVVSSTLLARNSHDIHAHSTPGNVHKERRDAIEALLRSANMYTIIGAGTQITAPALGYIYRTDNLIDALVNPAKDGTGDWKPTRNRIGKFFDDMERDIKLVTNSTSPVSNEVAVAKTDWVWDSSREQWYYWCSMDRTYKYHGGMWLRLDGSSTSLEEEVELAKARGVPSRKVGEVQDASDALAAPMQRLALDWGQDA
jgi:hypothetical protein